MSDEEQFIPGIFNYCDRWCERCSFTARCRLFADEKKFSEEVDKVHTDEENAAFWQSIDEMFAESRESADESSLESEDGMPLESKEEYEAREARISERTERDPLVKLSQDYGLDVHHWLQDHEQEIASSKRPTRDGVLPSEALDVISWHEFQIGVKLARASRGRFEAEEEIAEVEGDSWDTGSDWQDEENEDDIDLAAIHQQDADGSAKVALLGIERSLGAWTVLRDVLPTQDAQIQRFQQQLAKLRRLLDAAFPNARTFHRPGFDD